MRLVALSVSGIGGLVDGRIELPPGPIAAFAGANGTGKSKLLACLLSPWSHALPSARRDQVAEVSVEILLAQDERLALSDLSGAAGWGGPVVLPELVRVTTTHTPLVGLQRSSDPSHSVLLNAWTMQEFLQRYPSLDIVYLPAERRLLPPQQQGINLEQLSEALAWQSNTESRNAAQNYGRLDDREFEQFAKALCVADALPADEGEETLSRSTVGWSDFVDLVNNLIAPKELLPLTQQHPENLRIRTAAGDTHGVEDLSSGERQALVIISRVARAGADHTVVLIDEPDAYLHPQLSERLIEALSRGVGATGQLLVATHSPSILDRISPESILRLGHGASPRLVSDESERIELYRSAGFRASALTQSDLLMITEGESDVTLLRLLFPVLSRAAIRSAGGRKRVLREVEQLSPYELPILGVVDGDIEEEPAPDQIVVWPAADIEGVFLADDSCLDAMIELGLIKSAMASRDKLRSELIALALALRDNVVAEIAQRKLRLTSEARWPSPKGESPLARLADAVEAMKTITSSELETATDEASAIWEAHLGNPWTLVRGKYVLNTFAERASEMRSGQALLEAVARSQPQLDGFGGFNAKIADYLV